MTLFSVLLKVIALGVVYKEDTDFETYYDFQLKGLFMPMEFVIRSLNTKKMRRNALNVGHSSFSGMIKHT